MPILDVTMVLRDGETPAPDLSRRLADVAGRVFGAAQGTVWVALHTLPADRYAENDTMAAATPQPVLVRVLKAIDDPADVRAAEAAALAAALAACLSHDTARVHLIYEPAGAGRVAFGGRLLARSSGVQQQ
jgi:phenylpyruvate tautomerase PptA (4-oxalocrotonate tautomerase family)